MTLDDAVDLPGAICRLARCGPRWTGTNTRREMMTETGTTPPGRETWRAAVLFDAGYSGDDQYDSYSKVAQREFAANAEPHARAWVETVMREAEKRLPARTGDGPNTLDTAHYFGQLERGRYNEVLPGNVMWEVKTGVDPRFIATTATGKTIIWSDLGRADAYTLADDDFYGSTHVPPLFSDATVDQWSAGSETSAPSNAQGKANAVRLAGMGFENSVTANSPSSRWRLGSRPYRPSDRGRDERGRGSANERAIVPVGG